MKLPRAITHEGKLHNAREQVIAFLDQTNGLAEKRGPILVQLAPSLSFDDVSVSAFFEMVRGLYDGPMVCEPRHPSWFVPSVSARLAGYHVSRVAADPPPVEGALVPAGWLKLGYFRLHGSPRTYWSRYDGDWLATLATAARSVPGAEETWCVFDNTASGAAIDNAWDLQERLKSKEA